MSAPTIAVTGSTGALGGEVARILAEAGRAQRLLVRTPAKAPALPGAEVVQSSYEDGPGARAALAGVDVLLMVSAAESAKRLEQQRTFVQAAQEAGVGQVVYTSFVGAAPDAVFTLGRDHWWTEEAIRASGMAFTFLRDSFYLDFFASLPGPDGVIRGPAGDGRVAAVARTDVARAAAAVMQAPQAHRNATYAMTGPEALSMADVAAVLSADRETPVHYRDETLAEAYRSREQYAAPAWQVDAWVSTYTAIASGALAEVSGDVERLTGHPATSLAALLRGH